MSFGDIGLNWTDHSTTGKMSQNLPDVSHDRISDNTTQPITFVPYHPLTSFIEQYTIPVISFFGLISNTLSSLVFLQKPLRDNSCSIFLAARGFIDNGFLSTLLIVWISQTFNLQLGSLSGSCKIIIFLSYICGFISVWLVVFVTLENYIRICKPFVVRRFCTTAVAKVVVAFLCLTSVCMYNFPFWAMSKGNCLYLPRHRSSVQALIYTDTILTLVLPLCCIIYLMTAIVCNLVKSYRLRKLHRVSGTKTDNPLAKVTKMLFAVTVTFFCLNVPSHIYRYVKMISSFVNKSNEADRHSVEEEAIQQTTLLLSYVSMSTNMIVYIIFGSKFRSVFLQMCKICKCKSTRGFENILELQAQNGVGRNNFSTNENTPTSRSLTVLLTDKEWTSELIPLQRAYTK